MKHLPISDDKQRILDQLRVNFANMPDDSEEVELLTPHLAATASGVLASLNTGNFRPAELMALLSLVGPIRARTPVLGGQGKVQRKARLRAV